MCSALVFWIWGEKAGTPIIVVMFGFPVGCTVAPLLVSPFLQNNDLSSTFCNATTWSSANVSSNLTASCHPPQGQSRIHIAFGIIGCLIFLCGVPFWVLYWARPLRKYSLWGETKSSAREVLKTCSVGMTNSVVALVVLLSLFFVFYAAEEGSLGLFLFAYAVDSDLGFTQGQAALLNMAFRSSATTGVLLNAFLSRCLPIQVPSFTFLILDAIFSLCLTLLGPTDKFLFGVFSCLSSLCYVPLWGSVIAWYGLYVVVYSIHTAIFLVSFCVGMVFFVWLTGFLYEDYTPNAMLYVKAVGSFTTLLIMVAFHFVVSSHKKRYNLAGDEVEVNVKEDSNMIDESTDSKTTRCQAEDNGEIFHIQT